jgi:hypothetical protein
LVHLSELELSLGLEVLEIVRAQRGCSLATDATRNVTRLSPRAFP